MICVIRIHGRVGLKKDTEETLNRLRLRKKYACVIFKNPSKEQMNMIKKVRNFVAFGEINPNVYKKLVEKRENNNQDFFRLHSPRGGINSKAHFPVGVLGDNKDKINELVLKML